MKVFWAWQSDHPREISRDVVRTALEAAIEHLKVEKEVLEAPEESRGELNIDHDTKDLTGSPDVAAEILKKIMNCAVFVGDISIVGKTPDISGNEAVKPGRPLINSNVAIEYGFALRKLTDSAVLGVMNEYFGGPKDLPFDIIQKRWPIRYELHPDATKAEIDVARQHLRGQFINALRGFLDKPEEEPAFEEMQPKIGKAFYFRNEEALGYCNQVSDHVLMPFRDVLYMRLIPTKPLPRLVSEKAMLDNAYKYGAMGSQAGAIPIVNQYGVMCFSPAGNTNNVDALTQYFPKGEVWAINADIMRQGNRGQDSWYIVLSAEKAFMDTLNAGLHYLKNVAGAEMPIKVIAGVTGMRGRTLAVNNAVLGSFGKMMSDAIELPLILHVDSRQTQDKYLLQLFEKIFDQSGHARPRGLHGFPKE